MTGALASSTASARLGTAPSGARDWIDEVDFAPAVSGTPCDDDSRRFLVATAGAAPTASYTDPTADGNEAPDIGSVVVEDATSGAVNVRVELSNFEKLPSDSRIILEFDLDQDATTGVAGDELVVRFWDDELLEVLRWDGVRLSPSSADGMSVSSLSASRRNGRRSRTRRRSVLSSSRRGRNRQAPGE